MARYTMSIGILAQREVKRLARINYKYFKLFSEQNIYVEDL